METEVHRGVIVRQERPPRANVVLAGQNLNGLENRSPPYGTIVEFYDEVPL